MPVIKYKDPKTNQWIALGSGVLGTEIPFSEDTPENDNAWIDPASESLKYKDPTTGEVKEVGSGSAGAVYAVVNMLASKWVEKSYSFEDIYPSSKYDITVEIDSSATEEQFDAFGEAKICATLGSNVAKAIVEAPTIDIPVLLTITPKESKEVEVEVVMSADKWIDDKYSFEDVYPNADYDMTVEVSGNATEEQFEAFGEAKVCAVMGSNAVKAIGEVPTMDIPVILKVVGR